MAAIIPNYPGYTTTSTGHDTFYHEDATDYTQGSSYDEWTDNGGVRDSPECEERPANEQIDASEPADVRCFTPDKESLGRSKQSLTCHWLPGRNARNRSWTGKNYRKSVR